MNPQQASSQMQNGGGHRGYNNPSRGRGGRYQPRNQAPVGQQSYGGGGGGGGYQAHKFSGGGGGGGYRTYQNQPPQRSNLYLPAQMGGAGPSQMLPNGPVNNGQYPMGPTSPFPDEGSAPTALLPSPQNGQVMGNWQQQAASMSSGMHSPVETASLDMSPPISQANDSGVGFSPVQMAPMQQAMPFAPGYFNPYMAPQNPYFMGMGMPGMPGPYYAAPMQLPPNAYFMSPFGMQMQGYPGPAFPGGGAFVPIPPPQTYICAQCRQVTTQPPPDQMTLDSSNGSAEQPQ